jgi:vacuolar-type H+-ATPase subunit H
VAEDAIRSLQSFVANELAAVRTASTQEVEDIHRERARLIEEAANAADEHLVQTRDHADRILQSAKDEGERIRREAEREVESKREAFERELSERESQADRRANQILGEAEQRRHEADELYASASQAQAHMLASFEQARTALIEAAERGPSGPTVTRFEVAGDGNASETTRENEQHHTSGDQADATDAAA